MARENPLDNLGKARPGDRRVLDRTRNRQEKNRIFCQPELFLGLFSGERPGNGIERNGEERGPFTRNPAPLLRQGDAGLAKMQKPVTDADPGPELMIGLHDEHDRRQPGLVRKGHDRDDVLDVDVQEDDIYIPGEIAQGPGPLQDVRASPVKDVHMPLPRRDGGRERFGNLICGGAALTLAASAAFLVRFRDLDPLELVVVSLVLLPAIALGLLIAVRRPHARIAPVLCLTGAVPLVIGFGDVYGAAVAAHPGVLPVSACSWACRPAAGCCCTCPRRSCCCSSRTGGCPVRVGGVVAIGLLVVPVAFAALGMFDPDGFDAPYQDVPPPFGPAPDWLVPVAFALLPVFMALLVAAAAAMIVRYRRATDPVLRAQLRWFALAAAFLPLTLLLCWTSYVLLGDADLVVFGLALTLLALPTATAIALLRHDLYDVDRAVSAAATLRAGPAALLAVFTTVTVVAGAAARPGLGAPSRPVATAVCAVALAPLRTRLQRRVDARLYPLRQAVRAELSRLRTRIDDGRARPEDLEDTLRRALRDPDLRVGYVRPGRPAWSTWPAPPVGDGRRVPVHVGDTPVGALLPVRTERRGSCCGRSPPRAGARRADPLRLELTEALREVAASRARILHAGYEERRRLERDLHDGAQQRLVSLGMALRLAQRHSATPAST